MAAVEIKQVRKVYQRDTQEVQVLDGISLEVPAGGTLAVLGRNGVGKTTLLTTLMGITTREDIPTLDKLSALVMQLREAFATIAAEAAAQVPAA